MRGFGGERLLWLGAVLVARLLLLASDAPLLHRVDELYAGAAAREWAAGRAPGLAELAWDPYAGGSTLVILLAALGFPVLGESLLLLRLVGLGFGLGTAFVWLVIAERLLGRRGMRVLGALLVLAPPWYARLTLMAWGNHAESALPTALALLALTSPLPAPSEAQSRRRLFGFGLSAGLAVFFSYLSLVLTLPLLLLLPASRGSLRPGRMAAPLLVGLALGLLPWLWFNMSLGFSGLAQLGPSIPTSLPESAHKLWRLLALDLRAYLAPQATSEPSIEAIPWLAASGSALLALWRGGRELGRGRIPRVETALLGPLAAFLCAYGLSGFFIGPETAGLIAFRYLAPATPFGLMLIAYGASALRPRQTLALTVLLTLPVLSSLGRGLRGASRYALEASGASYHAYGLRTYEGLSRSLPGTLERLERIPDPRSREAALDGVARAHAGHAVEGKVDVDALRVELRSLAGLGGRRGVFVERYAELLSSPSSPLRLGLHELEQLVALTAREPGPGLVLIRAGVLASVAQGAPLDAVAASARRWPARATAEAWVGLGMAASRHSAELAPPPDAVLKAAFEAGFAQEWALRRLRELGSQGRTSPGGAAPAPVRSAAAGAAVREALRIMEPEEPLRRSWLAGRAGLAAFATEPGSAEY